MNGSAVPIIKIGENSNKFEFDKNAFDSILNKESDENCEIAIISVAGAFRQGKSFLLNFFINFLNSITVLRKNESSLLNDLEEKFTGFDWKRGTERQTSGILIWSEIFYYKMSNGKKIGILLMDTQGIFDNNTSIRDNVTIFALSNLLTSVQIFNLSKRIQENNLQHLQLFLEYGMVALNNNQNSHENIKPFQQIMFLIRDWSNSDEYQYGEIGGTKYVNDILQIKSDQHEELKTLRNQIKPCFEKINGFLLPHPGMKATTGANFDGKLKDLKPNFIQRVKELTHSVLAKEHIRVKKINGRNITLKEFKHLFYSYWKIFDGENMPPVNTIFYATAEAVCFAAIETGLEYYKNSMNRLITDGNKFVELSKVEEAHESFHKIALKIFSEKAVFGDKTLKESFLKELEENIKSAYENFLGKNKYKKTMDMCEDINNLNDDLSSIAETNQATSKGISGMESNIKGIVKSNEVKRAFMKEQYQHLEEKFKESQDAVRKSEYEKQEMLIRFQNATESMKEDYSKKLKKIEKKLDEQSESSQRTLKEMKDIKERDDAARNENKLSEIIKKNVELEAKLKDSQAELEKTVDKQNTSIGGAIRKGVSACGDAAGSIVDKVIEKIPILRDLNKVALQQSILNG